MKTIFTLGFLSLLSTAAFAEDCMIKDGQHCYMGMPKAVQDCKANLKKETDKSDTEIQMLCTNPDLEQQKSESEEE